MLSEDMELIVISLELRLFEVMDLVGFSKELLVFIIDLVLHVVQ